MGRHAPQKPNASKNTNKTKAYNVPVLYEDNHLLIVSKPAGMPCVPDSSKDLSLLDWGKQYLKRTRHKPGNVFLGVVHRIDRPVSGVVCFAITSKAASRLSDQLRKKAMKKTYLGISRFPPGHDRGVIETYLLKDRNRNRVTAISCSEHRPRNARLARTLWEYVGQKADFHLLRLFPETGRPHQLRVHCAYMGCVLAGDLKYGDRSPLEDASIALHASELRLKHPVKREHMMVHAPTPSLFPWTCFDMG